ncbi:hypothetical protein TNCV_4060551, partial [Trichonephila clavipes]
IGLCPDKRQTLDHLEDNNRRVIFRYTATNVGKSHRLWWTSRLDYIRSSRGSHMPEIILKV